MDAAPSAGPNSPQKLWRTAVGKQFSNTLVSIGPFIVNDYLIEKTAGFQEPERFLDYPFVTGGVQREAVFRNAVFEERLKDAGAVSGSGQCSVTCLFCIFC